MDKKTEKMLERLAEKNKSRDIAEENRKTLRKNTIGRNAFQTEKQLEEDRERNEFFNYMRRREF